MTTLSPEEAQAIREWFEGALMFTRPLTGFDIPGYAPMIDGYRLAYPAIREAAKLLGIEAPEWGEAAEWERARLEALKEESP